MPRYTLYNRQGVPHEVASLSAFCQAHSLDVEAMRNVVKGRVKQHRGWHLDAMRTQEHAERTAELDRRLAEDEAKYGHAFEMRWVPKNG